MRVLFFLALLFPSFASAYISVSPRQVNLGTVKVNQMSMSGYISVTNMGQESVNISVSNGCFGAFWTTNNCFSQLSPGMNCSMTVRFQPRRAGYQSCSIYVHDSEGSSANVHVSGYGVDW